MPAAQQGPVSHVILLRSDREKDGGGGWGMGHVRGWGMLGTCSALHAAQLRLAAGCEGRLAC